MRKAAVVFALAALAGGLLPAHPAYAWRCPDLAREARALLAGVQDPARKKTIGDLIEAGEKAHDEGNHDESAQKLEQALAELRR